MPENQEPDHPAVRYEYFEHDVGAADFIAAALPIARCYQHVFGTDRSWNEGGQCPKCSKPGADKKWNFHEAPPKCPDCEGDVQDYWPIPRIIGDMRQELGKPHAVCVVARMGSEVAGCCWGYSTTIEELEGHLNHGLVPEVRVQGIASALAERFPGVQRVVYLDEIFVAPEHQGQKIGRELFRRRHERFVAMGFAVITMRTKSDPPTRRSRRFGSTTRKPSHWASV